MSWPIALPTDMWKNNLSKLLRNQQRVRNNSSHRWWWRREFLQSIDHQKGVTFNNKILYTKIFSELQTDLHCFRLDFYCFERGWNLLAKGTNNITFLIPNLSSHTCNFLISKYSPSTLILNIPLSGGFQSSGWTSLHCTDSTTHSWYLVLFFDTSSPSLFFSHTHTHMYIYAKFRENLIRF